jgi:hypothetical protein
MLPGGGVSGLVPLLSAIARLVSASALIGVLIASGKRVSWCLCLFVIFAGLVGVEMALGEHDRDISKRIWNCYMKKFGDKYRLLKDENHIWHIKCKYGTIQLYSLINHQLCFTAEFRSKHHKTWFKKSLSKNGTITQESDLGIVYVFHEKFLYSMASKCLAYCKKNLSSDYRRLLSERMSNINKNKRKMAGK